MYKRYWLSIDALMEALQSRGLNLGVDTHLRVLRYIEKLENEPALESEIVLHRLAALLCRSAEQQRLFYEVAEPLIEVMDERTSASTQAPTPESETAKNEEANNESKTDNTGGGQMNQEQPDPTAIKTPPPPDPGIQTARTKSGPLRIELSFPRNPLRPWNTAEMDRALKPLREKEWNLSLDWDIPATIQRSIQQGGMLDIVYKSRKMPPQYLVLIDQQSPRDHLAGLYTELVAEMNRRDMVAEFYYYDLTPWRLWKNFRDLRTHTDIETLQNTYSGYKLIIVGAPEGLLDLPELRPSNLAAKLRENWKSVALLCTKPTADWGNAELSLCQLFPVVPAAAEGLASLYAQWNATEVLAPDWWRSHFPDLAVPELEDNPRARAKENKTNPAKEADKMLRHYLGRDAYYWLCAAAVYPELYWELTSLLNDESIPPQRGFSEWDLNQRWQVALLRLCRLSWFRKGHIPEENREILLQYFREKMPPEQRSAVRLQLLQVLGLDENRPPDGSWAAAERAYTLVSLNQEREREKLRLADLGFQVHWSREEQEFNAAQRAVNVEDLVEAVGRSRREENQDQESGSNTGQTPENGSTQGHTTAIFTPYIVHVTAEELNVRNAPSATAPIVGRVNKGARLVATGMTEQWLKIGQNRYIASKFIEKGAILDPSKLSLPTMTVPFTILWVEEQSTKNLEFRQRLTNDHGIHFSWAANAGHAIDLLTQAHYDMVVTELSSAGNPWFGPDLQVETQLLGLNKHFAYLATPKQIDAFKNSGEEDIKGSIYTEFSIDSLLTDHILQLAAEKEKLFSAPPPDRINILWVDDHPQTNENLVTEMEQAYPQIQFITVKTTEEAIATLREYGFRAIISNLGRDGNPEEGMNMLRLFKSDNANLPQTKEIPMAIYAIRALEFREMLLEAGAELATNNGNDLMTWVGRFVKVEPALPWSARVLPEDCYVHRYGDAESPVVGILRNGPRVVVSQVLKDEKEWLRIGNERWLRRDRVEQDSIKVISRPTSMLSSDKFEIMVSPEHFALLNSKLEYHTNLVYELFEQGKNWRDKLKPGRTDLMILPLDFSGDPWFGITVAQEIRAMQINIPLILLLREKDRGLYDDEFKEQGLNHIAYSESEIVSIILRISMEEKPGQPLNVLLAAAEKDANYTREIKGYIDHYQARALNINLKELPHPKTNTRLNPEVHLTGMDVVLFVVTPRLLENKDIMGDILPAAAILGRAQRLRLVPIILESCNWQSTPLRHWPSLPNQGKPYGERTRITGDQLNLDQLNTLVYNLARSAKENWTWPVIPANPQRDTYIPDTLRPKGQSKLPLNLSAGIKLPAQHAGTSSQSPATKWRNQIANAELLNALDDMLDFMQRNNEQSTTNKLILLKAQLNQLNKDRLTHILNDDDYNYRVNIARINNALLGLVKEYEQTGILEQTSAYTLARRFGEGSYGEIWEAEAPDGQRVIVKIWTLDDERLNQNFRQEYERVSRLDHPNIIKYIELGEYQSRPFIVMPFYERGDLMQFKGKLREEQAWQILEDLSDALDYLHKQSPAIVHNDIKPQNVLIDEDGNAILIDFGISRLDRDQSPMQGLPAPAYRAPEYEEGRPRLTSATDIWALGVMLFELLTGALPFGQKGVQDRDNDAVEKALRGQRYDAKDVLSEDLYELIISCLKIAPQERLEASLILKEAVYQRSEKQSKSKFQSKKQKESESMAKNDDKTPLIFISYAQKDEAMHDKLRRHLSMLERGGYARIWSDRAIDAGRDWDKDIKDALNEADIYLFLVSDNLLNTQYVWEVEIGTALRRVKNGEARAVPIILSPCDWQMRKKGSDAYVFPFAQYQGLPDKGKPISTYASEDEAFTLIARALRKLVDD